MTAVKISSPFSSQSRSSPRTRRQWSLRLLWSSSSSRQFLLFVTVVTGTVLVAFHEIDGPSHEILHANPVRRGITARRDDGPPSVRATTSSSSSRPRWATHDAANVQESHRTPPSQPFAEPVGTLKEQVRRKSSSSSSSSCKFRVRSVRDLQTCYPPDLVKPLGPTCDRIEEWADVQRCLNTQPRLFTDDSTAGAVRNDPSQVQIDHYDISLIGERNSGTKFLIQELQQCFRSLSASTNVQGVGSSSSSASLRALARDDIRHRDGTARPTVKIHRDFHRHKHFFQPLYAGENYRHRIVIALFRDPVEWVAAMRENPYHSPAHVAGYRRTKNDGEDTYTVVPLPWQEFVRRPWTTDRTPKDLDILRNVTSVKETLKGETCLYRYSILDAVPCVFDNETKSYPSIPDSLLRGYVPLYELRRDHSLKPFDNLLQLRAEKIVNFLVEVPLVYRHLGGYVAARYEDLLRQGTRPLLEHVAGLMGLPGLPSDCIPAGPQPDRLGRREIPNEFRRWIIDHMDEDLERLLGYVGSPPTTLGQ